jgi:hypothetical protein
MLNGMAKVFAPWRRTPPPLPMVSIDIRSYFDDARAVENGARRLFDGADRCSTTPPRTAPRR